jgi:metallo-beta-lactamase class B
MPPTSGQVGRRVPTESSENQARRLGETPRPTLRTKTFMGVFLAAGLIANIAAAAETPSPQQPRDPRPYQTWKILFDSWRAPVPPRHIIGNIYYVGAIGVSSFLITTPQGHILLDSGLEDTVPIIEKGVADLGFRVSDIKILLNSHGHSDHAGGMAKLRQHTGASVYASAAEAKMLETGDADNPNPADLFHYTPVHVDHVVTDLETVTLGGVTLTAHLTPGHTKGATTWTMDVTDEGHVYHVVFHSSASSPAKLIGNAGYPNVVDDLEKSFATWKAMPCDIFFAPHGGQFAMAQKFERLAHGATPNPFIDPAGWRAKLADEEKAFREQLESEKQPNIAPAATIAPSPTQSKPR